VATLVLVLPHSLEVCGDQASLESIKKKVGQQQEEKTAARCTEK